MTRYFLLACLLACAPDAPALVTSDVVSIDCPGATVSVWHVDGAVVVVLTEDGT